MDRWRGLNTILVGVGQDYEFPAGKEGSVEKKVSVKESGEVLSNGSEALAGRDCVDHRQGVDEREAELNYEMVECLVEYRLHCGG